MCIFISGQLTVYFECPFWVGVFEMNSGNTLSICKLVFGSEPKDTEIYSLILNDYYDLNFSKPLPSNKSPERPKSINPKRLQRQIKNTLEHTGIGTKSQQAIKQLQEQKKEKRKKACTIMKRENTEKKFEQKQQKKKEKLKGH